MRAKWETSNRATLNSQERLQAAILRTQRHLPTAASPACDGDNHQATDRNSDAPEEINQINLERHPQTAADVQAAKEDLQKQYEERLKEAEAKDNTPGRGKVEFAPQ